MPSSPIGVGIAGRRSGDLDSGHFGNRSFPRNRINEHRLYFRVGDDNLPSAPRTLDRSESVWASYQIKGPPTPSRSIRNIQITIDCNRGLFRRIVLTFRGMDDSLAKRVHF